MENKDALKPPYQLALLSFSFLASWPAPPVGAERRSRYRGPVAPGDGTGVAPADGTRVKNRRDFRRFDLLT